MQEGGKTTGSSSAVINLGSDTGLRGLASTVPHNWVTHRGRPTQAIMWRSVGRGLAEVGEGVHKHTHARRHLIICDKTTQPSFTQWEITEVQTVKENAGTRQCSPSSSDVVTAATCVYMLMLQQLTPPRQHPQVKDSTQKHGFLNFLIYQQGIKK